MNGRGWLVAAILVALGGCRATSPMPVEIAPVPVALAGLEADARWLLRDSLGATDWEECTASISLDAMEEEPVGFGGGEPLGSALGITVDARVEVRCPDEVQSGHGVGHGSYGVGDPALTDSRRRAALTSALDRAIRHAVRSFEPPRSTPDEHEGSGQEAR